ncbi:MAG: hypothetical protein JWO00_167 [Candidatus Parcubacteria bacterium]|nr:hypothetical protein [Candidatus Parcubacteria bacterium]
MPQTKTIRSKHIKKAPAPAKVSEEDVVEGADTSFAAKKIKKEVELEVDEVLPPTEKLLEEVSPFGDVPVEDDEDEATLDDEELNPFGDKWEV